MSYIVSSIFLKLGRNFECLLKDLRVSFQVAVEGDSARTMDEAITLLENLTTGDTPAIDRHPERRLKATFEAFEAARLPSLKTEYPNMRLSQLRQMIRKEWQKSPENPLNQRVLAYNTKAVRQPVDE